jgi:broad specificity phosphatase PhoE
MARFAGRAFRVVLIALELLTQPRAGAGEDAWALLAAPSHVALLRHADAPGGPGIPSAGDPAHFRLEDCATQRNLSAAGRAQAQRLAAQLKKRNVTFTRVLSSRWCRCLETARLATGEDPEPFPPLDNFFADRSRAPAQLAELEAFLATIGPEERVLMVSHGVVIAGLTGAAPAQGELVILRLDGRGGFSVAGRLRVD